MPEISAERLAELEAMEEIIQHIVLPQSRYNARMMEMERCWKHSTLLTDKETENLMGGHAMWDDPPNGWSKKKLVTWSQGYLYGREVVGMNVGQSFERFVRALRDPVNYWRNYRLSFLEMIEDAKCEGSDCTGSYKVDTERIGMECDSCHTFMSYGDVVELIEKEG